jgi:phosphonate degradation associated HDIG domain protein
VITDELIAIYRERGAAAYFGEPVSTAEHSLQAAHFAANAGAPDSLIVAALLHDIGHLIESVPDDIAEWKTDARHELKGGRWLAARFGPEVSEPVRLHVPAKRYLCATDSEYFSKLSAASVITLQLQGGPMSNTEIRRFVAETYWQAAVLLRRCDDQGKVAGMRTPDFDYYRERIEQAATSGRRA